MNELSLTLEEELVFLDLTMKALNVRAKAIREQLPASMSARKVEVVSAYADATKVARVRLVEGNVTAQVIDPEAAVQWCATRYPGEVEEVVSIMPAFLRKILEYSKAHGRPGDGGIDPGSGESLDFIRIVRGEPYVKVEPTDAAAAQMEALTAYAAKATEHLWRQAQPEGDL